MRETHYTLVSDGSSDRALIPILNWLLQQYVGYPIQAEWADLRRLRKPPTKLSDRIRLSLELYPCDLLFVHRDAEKERLEVRVEEIHRAWEEIKEVQVGEIVCVVPIRMLEAWLLVDEKALRRAAGNPYGQNPLNMPQLRKLEKRSDPKKILHTLLRQASGLSGRRQERFLIPSRVHRVAEFIEDFSLLRALRAFSTLEKEVVDFIKKQKSPSG